MDEISFTQKSVGVCADGKDHIYITCGFLFIYDIVVYVLSRFMPVGFGWPGPVFGPALLHFIACGGG